MRARLPISASRLISAFAPAPTPITLMRPPVGQRVAGSRAGWARRRARGSRRTGRARRSPRARSPRRPSAPTGSRSSVAATVAVTRGAGRARRAGSRPCRPRRPPRAPAGARRRRSAACVKSASWAVVKTSGSPPAAAQSSDSGTGISTRSWTTTSSAWAPPPTIAITRSPAAKRSAPGPERDDLARELHAGDVRRGAGRCRVQPAPLHHVRAVQAGGADRDEHLAGARRRGRDGPRRGSPSRGS